MSAASVTAAPLSTPSVEKQAADQDARWAPVLGLSCRLSIDLSMPSFKVSDFVRLIPGTIINTGWGIARDVPLRANGILIGWGELEGAGNRLAVRVTELA